MTTYLRLLAGVLLGALASLLLCAGASAKITEYPTPTAGSLPVGITTGPDGALWFTESNRSKIGRITTSGAISEFPTPTQPSFPNAITAGPDGALWFTEPIGSGKIGRITTDGSFTEFKTPEQRVGAVPEQITAGPDGALWYTQFDKIGRLTTDGSFTEFPLSGTKGAAGITAGPDGALWFAEFLVDKIGRITTSGTISEFRTPTSPSPDAITAGPDGALWFTELGDCNPGVDCYDAQIGRITTSGTISEFPIPHVESNPAGITTGPDGALWFTQIGANNGGEFHCGVCFAGGEIGRITTSGAITEFPIPDDTSQPRGITAGPDGAIWFTEYWSSKIGRIPVVPVTKAQCRHGGWRVYPQFKNQGQCIAFVEHRSGGGHDGAQDGNSQHGHQG